MPWVSHEKLIQYAAAVEAKGAPLQNCWGFIDGTVRAICRPSVYQREMYNGHKRYHALKFQSICTPDGYISHFCGPFNGYYHDARILRESCTVEWLEENCIFNGEVFPVYGDPAYGRTQVLQSPFREPLVDEYEKLFNKRMSSVRECVEWGFGKVYLI